MKYNDVSTEVYSSVQLNIGIGGFEPLQIIEYAYALDSVSSTMVLQILFKLNIQLNVT